MCFRCDDKWAPNHRCKRRELSVLLTVDGDVDEAEFGGDEELNTVETTEEEPIYGRNH